MRVRRKPRVAHLLFGRGFCAAPHPSALDVYADEVFVGVAFGQRNGVFAAPAAQFEYDRVRIAEKVFAPTAFEPEIGAEYLFEFGLRPCSRKVRFSAKRLSLSFPRAIYRFGLKSGCVQVLVVSVFAVRIAALAGACGSGCFCGATVFPLCGSGRNGVCRESARCRFQAGAGLRAGMRFYRMSMPTAATPSMLPPGITGEKVNR